VRALSTDSFQSGMPTAPFRSKVPGPIGQSALVRDARWPGTVPGAGIATAAKLPIRPGSLYGREALPVCNAFGLDDARCRLPKWVPAIQTPAMEERALIAFGRYVRMRRDRLGLLLDGAAVSTRVYTVPLNRRYDPHVGRVAGTMSQNSTRTDVLPAGRAEWRGSETRPEGGA
jgi:hypothetical protein